MVNAASFGILHEAQSVTTQNMLPVLLPVLVYIVLNTSAVFMSFITNDPFVFLLFVFK